MSDEIKRRRDWLPRLTAYIIPRMRREFAYGEHDCALFAAGAVEAMTGVDLAKGMRGYKTEAGGAKRMLAKGYSSTIEIADKHFARVPASFARVGDLAALDGGAGLALGVVQGEFIYVLTPDGMGLKPLRSAEIVWRVP